uniref:Peroxisomal acyl-coenzyme A oxidase 1 n=1 Tax=Ciona savignyi TaxID=51511 RepID=H2YNM7_CIOSA
MRDLKNGAKLPGSVAYLACDCKPQDVGRDFTDFKTLASLYKLRALGQIRFANSKVEAGMAQGKDLVGSLNEASVYLVRAAIAHTHYYVVRNFFEKISALSVSSSLMEVLHQVALFYALDGIAQNSGEFLEDGLLSGADVKGIRQLSVDMLPRIRVNAVALVDAFEFGDDVLGSVLGRYDGNVYENLFKWAQNSSLNKTDVHPSYHKYIRPLLKRNQSKL